MFKRMSLALLTGASCLGVALDQATAIEVAPLPDPAVIYADQVEQQPAAPARTAYAERSNMGGGFIEFLFGDGQGQSGRYRQQPAYQPPPSYSSPQSYGPPQQASREPE